MTAEQCGCVSNSRCHHDDEMCWHHMRPHGQCPTVHRYRDFYGAGCGEDVHNEDGDLDRCRAEPDDPVHAIWQCVDERAYHDDGPCQCPQRAQRAETDQGEVLPSRAGEPTCHCGRLAEDGDVICGHCTVRRYQSNDDTCCREDRP